MKYKKIYDVIWASGCSRVDDRSYWHLSNPDIVERNRPLWIILVHSHLNLRLWVTHEFGKLRITTAQLDLDCNSGEYSKSIRYYDCKNQADMAEKLGKLLRVETQSAA